MDKFIILIALMSFLFYKPRVQRYCKCGVHVLVCIVGFKVAGPVQSGKVVVSLLHLQDFDQCRRDFLTVLDPVDPIFPLVSSIPFILIPSILTSNFNPDNNSCMSRMETKS